MSSPSKPPRSETQPVSRSIQKHSSLLTSLYAVVMAGGYGVRLWPESRRRYPKPFLKISTGQTLLSQTFERLNAIIPNERKILITGQSMAASARKAAPFLREEQILQEPQSKNTAACIGWAAVELLQKDPDAIMLVLPSDHLIRPPENFCATVIQAVTLIQKDSQRLVTLGIPPASPATSYGYIEAGKQLQPIPDLSDVFDCLPLEIPAFAVRQFREKPSREKAMEFLNSGRF
ncbi:MAG: hypothetical protein IKW74_05150, partial [Thermoguttaceae bacterium]|nr:hypothetical protein [Thermoguttaceae bacterium]